MIFTMICGRCPELLIKFPLACIIHYDKFPNIRYILSSKGNALLADTPSKAVVKH